MVNVQVVNLVDLTKAMAQMKGLTGSSQDGCVVGIDSVSGDDYFAKMPSIGAIYIGASGDHRIIVDALAYPSHVSNGTRYSAETRMISVAFDKNTLDIIPGSRRNIGYASLAKRTIVALDPFQWVLDRKDAADKAAKAAAEAKKKADAKAKADRAAKAKTDALRTMINL